MLFAPSFFSLSWQLLICRKSSLLTLNDCSLKDSTYSDSLSSSFLLTKHPATTLIASSSVCQCMFCIVSNLIALLSESLICVVVLWAIILMIVSLTRFPTNGFQFIFRVIELSVTTGQLLKFAQNTRRFLCPHVSITHETHTTYTHIHTGPDPNCAINRFCALNATSLPASPRRTCSCQLSWQAVIIGNLRRVLARIKLTCRFCVQLCCTLCSIFQLKSFSVKVESERREATSFHCSPHYRDSLLNE